MENHKKTLINHLLTATNYAASDEDVKTAIKKLNLRPSYPIVLVGGTNGKGSTCAYLTTILTNAGYKVGTYTSPHIFDYNERITINNIPVSDPQLVEALEKVMSASSLNLGMFKSFTLASHIIFDAHKIDIAIVEVGLGGAQDTTNLFEPTISAITGVALDHCDILGDTIEEIAMEKVQIFRPIKPAFFGSSSVPQAIIDYAHKINADLELAEVDFSYKEQQYSWDFISKHINYYSLPFPSLRGHEQLKNASLAIAILNKLRSNFPLSVAQIKSGLLQTSLIGRFQVMPGIPQIVLDTAHNPEAIEVMCYNMLKLPFAKRNFALFGIADDKDWQQAIKKCLPSFDVWYLTWINSSRSCDPQKVADYLISLGVRDLNIHVCDNVSNAFNYAYKDLKADDRLVCFGSFLVIDAAHKKIQEVRK